ncbi:Protochlorophyllide-dependent translocon component 52, chloroplastic [Vitis vinifera]|uniref:Protochlorophyllide-dependent translocon component 52, chloroplastic n=1 Tax=Vitis vinifera TaxID=29760 RepID=A0A438JV13_VITVI|nr:Protochlorophyllide-dependent translocon component 52, chloroplastic [Vitis vinifera]
MMNSFNILSLESQYICRQERMTRSIMCLGCSARAEVTLEWYPVASVCHLDKRKPHAKRVMGLDVAVWWDRNESEWKVFDDSCAHGLAPLSEGMIDQWGQLQCVCTMGSVSMALVHTFKKARAAVYPSAVQNGIVWFWPNTDSQFKDILTKKKPPYIQNWMTPHVPSPWELDIFPSGMQIEKGETPIEISVMRLAIDGFVAEWELARSKFIPSCLCYTCLGFPAYQSNGSVSSDLTKEEPLPHVSPNRALLILICVPEYKLMKAGLSNWQKACFMPTKSDAHIVAFRAWDPNLGVLTVPQQSAPAAVAYKGLHVLEVVLHIFSIALIRIPAINHGAMSVAAGTTLSSKDFEDPSLVWRHLRIYSDGNLRIFSWDDAGILYCTCLWLSWDGFRMFWVQENGGFGKLQDEYKNDCLMRS